MGAKVRPTGHPPGNAASVAVLSLGGAINVVSKTGRTAPGNYARFEVGSYGYRKQQLSTAGVVGDSDYYINVLHNERDGYQDQANNEGRGLAANFGHVLSPRLETDQRYASAANTAYNANGRDSAHFYPGDAFSVTTGVAVRF